MRFIPLLLLLNVFFAIAVVGQDTLPRFSAVIKSNGKIVISWHNNFEVVTQISIQRSYDSLKNFTTLLTVPDPTIPENGFVDNKQPDPNMFYRLFILLENGNYIFSKSKRPVTGMASDEIKNNNTEEDNALSRIDNQRIRYLQDNGNKTKPKISIPSKINEPPKVELEKTIFIKEKDSLIGQLSGKVFLRFKDSILNKTKDTLLFVNGDTILIKAFVPKEVYRVSIYVFTARDGNITISLPDADTKKYAVKFLEQDNSPVLEIKEIKESSLIVDKTNFIHAGWFRFELYEDGRLKEKNRVFIPKEF